MTVPAPRQLFDRQKRLLGLLHALGGAVARLDFQKLLLLYCEEYPNLAPYEFVPYKYGGFSFSSYADWRKLAGRGLLDENDREWRLTAAGSTVVEGLRIDATSFTAFAARHRGVRGDALVAESYRRFPYYAIRSEMAERVLAGDCHALDRIANARPEAGKPGLMTIGYEGRSVEGYLNELIRAGVSVLCDVRRNAISRKYGFSKGTLARGCEGVGIRYEHLPELGIASEDRRGLTAAAEFSELFADYRRATLPAQGPALQQIRDWIHNGERVALTCYEHVPRSCHRHCIAESLAQTYGPEFEAIDL